MTSARTCLTVVSTSTPSRTSRTSSLRSPPMTLTSTTSPRCPRRWSGSLKSLPKSRLGSPPSPPSTWSRSRLYCSATCWRLRRALRTRCAGWRCRRYAPRRRRVPSSPASTRSSPSTWQGRSRPRSPPRARPRPSSPPSNRSPPRRRSSCSTCRRWSRRRRWRCPPAGRHPSRSSSTHSRSLPPPAKSVCSSCNRWEATW